ncbi:uncharacterized protein LOC130673819 [Microplitis mediator]|uniref:uncharacterized protein LOC130673819 n=1 Tax=Microplitis mediator TaxID=375433 RepID=UPI002555B212|nr:uncharacterized protein LOC130673819 [Microplitis mediator]
MDYVCSYCGALKWKDESVGMCCLSGQIKLWPITAPPDPLMSLLNGDHSKSESFLKNIRKYNSLFQMTSFRAKQIDKDKYNYSFIVQGQVHHSIGSIYPHEPNQEKFLQVYFIDNHDTQLKQRCKNINCDSQIDKNLAMDLQLLLRENNIYVKKFQSVINSVSSNDDKFQIVIRSDRIPAGDHKGRYNSPQSPEIAILISGEEFSHRDIVIHGRDNVIRRINELHYSYDSLQYPLIFSRGEDGYSICIPKIDPASNEASDLKTVSAMCFYAFRIMIRKNNHNHLHYYRSLFSQYLVDMYAKIESERLVYIKTHQAHLRAENYIHLQDAISKDVNLMETGKSVILPSSFTGSARYMHERVQDGMTYVRNHKTPDLFITFTCNPKWKEISDNLFSRQTPADRHDIISRVFRLKVVKLMNSITKAHIFGEVSCYMYTVEWQKRGLPHIHLLLWLKNKITPEQIDDIIKAEFPDPQKDPTLFEIMKKHMVHGPCGQINHKSPCMQDGKCSKKFPKQFVSETETGNDSYPKYQRRSPADGGFTATMNTFRGEIQVDNRWVVPYNPLLSKIFNAHINVEYCNSIKSIKYICKYINKGSDQATFSIKNENDEVEIFQSGRYISSAEAAWRILSFPIHERHPTVTHLAVHLENRQRVYFNERNCLDRVLAPPKTTLTAFFELCQTDNFAKTLLYCEIPAYYTWSENKFHRRKRGNDVPNYSDIKKTDALERVYTVHPNNFECYCLRMLLHQIRGPTSFQSLKVVDNIQHETFHAACKAFGLLEDDKHWEYTMQDAAISESPFKLRNLFVIILVFCHVSDPTELWLKFRNEMSEDLLHSLREKNNNSELDFNDGIYNDALILIEDLLNLVAGKTSKDFNFESPTRNHPLRGVYMKETSYNIDALLLHVNQNEKNLTDEQRNVYETVINSIIKKLGQLIFLDAPGGTGKTYLLNLILAKIRADGKIALAVASSGIAATLLLGGKTAHSLFKLPLDLNRDEFPVCNISKQSELAIVMKECDIIVWDECTMANKKAFEAVDR